jgi:hypothetical protein
VGAWQQAPTSPLFVLRIALKNPNVIARRVE